MANSNDNPLLNEEDDRISRGVLREEALALKDLFGLAMENLSFTVESSRTLAQSSMKDVLFLAIDIDGLNYQTPQPLQFQLGISILDTRRLQALMARDSQESEPENIFQTYNFCYGPPSYCRRAKEKFLFGETEEMVAEEINAKIQSLVLGRQVILVVHGGENDLRFLERQKISIDAIYVLDTQKAAQNPLRLSSRPSLESLLTALEIPFARHDLHIAGNDANYTLRSLLMIAVTDSKIGIENGLNDTQHAVSRVLQDIARAPLPGNRKRKYPVQGPGRKARTEARRMKRERKAARKLARANGQVEDPDGALELCFGTSYFGFENENEEVCAKDSHISSANEFQSYMKGLGEADVK